jgi:transcriptional regulator with XRE-family HTH domain
MKMIPKLRILIDVSERKLQEIADQAGINRVSLSQILAGDRQASTEQAGRISTALGIQRSELFDDDPVEEER